MSVSLHTATVGTYLQLLGSVSGMLDKAEAHCRDQGLPDTALTELRLANDMWPFAKQVFECAHHSARAIEGVRAGVFRPEIDPVPSDFAALRTEIAAARALLEAVEPGELETLSDRPLRFEIGSRTMEYGVEDFLLSFSLPNFFFHVSMTYAILRSAGLAVGKRDYLGRVRMAAPR